MEIMSLTAMSKKKKRKRKKTPIKTSQNKAKNKQKRKRSPPPQKTTKFHNDENILVILYCAYEISKILCGSELFSFTFNILSGIKQITFDSTINTGEFY